MLGAWVVLAVVASTDWQCEYARGRWQKAGLAGPCEVVHGASGDAVAAAKKAWSLTDEQARCALAAFAEPEPAENEGRTVYANGGPAGWRRCVGRFPGVFALWLGLFESTYDVVDVSALAGVDQGVALASRLLEVESAPSEGLARVILEQQPGRLVELLEHPHVIGRDAFALALPLLDTAGTRTPPLTPKEWEAVGFAALQYALFNGWLELAADVWHALPEATRGTLRSKPLLDVQVMSNGKDWRVVRQNDLRPVLALALIVTGHLDEARAVPLGPADGGVAPNGFLRMNLESVRGLVDFHLGRAKPDPWESALGLGREGVPAEADAALLPWLAPYEGIVRRRLEWSLSNERQDFDVADSVKPRVAAAHAKAMARVRAAWTKRMGPAKDAVDAGAPAVSLPDVAWPFVERKTPWKGRAPVVVAKPDDLPRGLWLVRAERSGTRRVVLALSQRVDPTGEVSMGGYWLLVSKKDGGWRELYLGLVEHRPFHAEKTSKVPLLDEKGVVRLDLQEAAIVEKTVTFPPVATKAPVTRAHVVFEATLDDVAKDKDGDGLSDLLEARLLLDPASRDTDGDGFSDRDDATPRLDDRLPSTPLAQVYNAFFETFSEGAQPQALVVPPNGDRSLRASVGTPKPMDLEQTRFLVAPGGTLAGLRPLSFVITLTPDELALARKKFGAFYPMDLEVHVSTDGKHGFVRWSEGWRGGSMRFDQGADGRWKSEVLESWIT